VCARSRLRGSPSAKLVGRVHRAHGAGCGRVAPGTAAELRKQVRANAVLEAEEEGGLRHRPPEPRRAWLEFSQRHVASSKSPEYASGRRIRRLTQLCGYLATHLVENQVLGYEEPLQNTVSTEKKSVATIVEAWAARKSRQMSAERRGAGGMQC
jgi:hypothetical protein